MLRVFSLILETSHKLYINLEEDSRHINVPAKEICNVEKDPFSKNLQVGGSNILNFETLTACAVIIKNNCRQ